MRYSERLSFSFKQYWQNRSLLSVLLLEFIARTIFIAICIIVDIFVVMWVNGAAINAVPDVGAFLNIKTYTILAILLILQFIGLLYINSFFSAGLFGMLKNVIQDGSTTFDEFMPSAKRYWYETFRYLLLPYGIMMLALLPFMYIYGVMSVMVTLGAMPYDGVLVPLLVTLLIAVAATIIVLFWFSYGPAIIVFEDASAWDAIKESCKLAKRNAGKTALMSATCIIIVAIAFLLMHGINIGMTMLGMRVQAAWFDTARRIIELLLNIVIISASVIAGIFIFRTYDDLTMRKAARHVRTGKPEHQIKRKV
jgi:hypothetical protein